MSLHWHAMPEAVPGVLRDVAAAIRGWDFYLAGGTALALHLGHRVSLDIDLFSPTFSAPDVLAADLEKNLPSVRVGLIDRRTLYVTVKSVQVSFLGYDYPLLEQASQPEEDLPPIAAIADIAAMKLAAVASRGSRKDFVDLWAILGSGWTLKGLLDLYSRKFRTRDIGHMVRSLTYFDDAEMEPPLQVLIDAPWERVTHDLTTRVEELLFEE